MIIALIIILLVLTVLMCLQESKKRKIELLPAILICVLLSPFIGYFIISNRPLRNPKGCLHCGNEYNEVEFCGICGKNVAGELRRKSS